MAVEKRIGMPLSEDSIILAVTDDSDISGWHHGEFIAVSPNWIEDEKRRARLLAHEVAHYYSYSQAAWMREGNANAMEHLATGAVLPYQGASISPDSGYPCTEHQNLASVEEADLDYDSPAIHCIYSLEERLMLSLLESTGEERFYSGIAELYRMWQEDSDTRANPVGQLRKGCLGSRRLSNSQL